MTTDNSIGGINMGSGLYFTIAALFIIVLVAIMFFFKKHHNTVETKLYSWLIITNLIGLIRK